MFSSKGLIIKFNENTSRKDVRLPVHLQRAMAAEAEAAREARAKVRHCKYFDFLSSMISDAYR